MQDNRSNNTDVIEKLLKEKFGNLFDWKLPVTLKTVGPYSPEVFISFDARRTELIDECRTVLEKITTPDLAILFHPKFDDPDGKRSAWDKLLRSEITELSEQGAVWAKPDTFTLICVKPYRLTPITGMLQIL